jgi:ABC-type microcin C transport system permease subunit YejB
MLAYAARRLAALPPTLFIIVTVAFVVVRVCARAVRLTPSSPCRRR